MACTLVAGVVSEILPLQRSYWVPLTVAIVLKPDYGSVFARALQRGVGTVVGAVFGAVVLTLVHGTWLLIPFAILAALLPFGRSRNYGLLAVFLTPLVVVLIDLLEPAGWHLALDRLQDTLIGCLDRRGGRLPAVVVELVRAPARAIRDDGLAGGHVPGDGAARRLRHWPGS